MFCACSFHGNSMNNLLSCIGLVDARISASEKYLPVMVAMNKVIAKGWSFKEEIRVSKGASTHDSAKFSKD